MNKLEEDKLKEEIKSLKVKRYIDFIKGFALIVGSIVLFLAIQMPESILNKKLSSESISRDRAKLVFELIHNNKEYKEILLELSVIEKAYPDNDNIWINEIKNIYKTKLDGNSNNLALNFADSTENDAITLLRKELRELFARKEQSQIQYISEITGRRQTGISGQGPVAKALQSQIDDLNIRIKEKQKEIDDLKSNKQ